MKKYILLFNLLLIGMLQGLAQCPMCRSAVVSSLEAHDSKVVGLGLNSGILIMLGMVYTIIMLGVGLWYYYHKKAHKGTV